MDLNSNGKTIGTIIITIIFLIGLIIIIDEIYNLTKFAYRYTYLYNYGIMNEKVCEKNKLEYETARFRIYNDINKYKLEKDIFNKTWLNYLVYIAVFILSILLSIAFGCLFYYLFINNNPNCETTSDNMSVLKQILQCLCADCHQYIPNCFINYFMLFILIVIYPLIYISKIGIKLDLTWNAGYYTKLLHILFFIGLVYYIIVIFMENKDDKYNKALIYTFFIIIFYMNNHIFNKTFEEFNSVSKVYNLYDNKNENLKEADTTFFDVYKQEEPLKPISLETPYSSFNHSNLLQVFKYCNNDNDFTDNSTINYCNKIGPEGYKKDKEQMDTYYKNLENYENDMKIYKDKYNIYINNKTDFPDVVYILYTMLPKLTGIQKTEVQILFILLVILIIITYYLKVNKNEYSDYVFYTAFIYILGILSIIIITNAVLNYNTYVNKYLIYEPIQNYKNYMNNKNTIFNLIIKKDKGLIEFYKKTKGDNTTEITIGSGSGINDFNIDDFITKLYDDIIDNSKPAPTTIYIDVLLNFQLKFYKTIYSYTITDTNYTSDKTININNYYDTNNNYLEISGGTTANFTDYKNLKEYIKILLVNDENTIDNRIEQLKINYKYYVYNINKEDYSKELKFEKNAIKKKSEIKDKPLETDYDKLYENNLYLTDKAFDVYKKLLIDCRKIFVELFNNLKISCNYTNFIDIDEKIAELDKVLLDKEDFKNTNAEPAITIYKKIILNTIKNLNVSLRKHINVIKFYIRLFEIEDDSSTNNKKNIITKIINNYNLFANDEDKHTDNDFIKILMILKSNFKNSKYNNMDSIDLKKLSLSTNNVSWSFIILIIIFTIILLEPLII